MLQTNASTQNTIKLNINHQLGNIPFALNTGAQNNISHDFEITRLNYYLSTFTIVHDGGTETDIIAYALVDAASTTTIELGNHNINSVEAVKFYIGVDSLTNHKDPSLYFPTHPLAPKSPSMHWGWSGGYRFVALEGNGSSNYNQVIELHGLGDENYFQATVPTTATAANNEVVININADYTQALKDISVNNGVTIHGTGGRAQQLLMNLSQYVFSAISTSVLDFSEVNNFEVFPNPTTRTTTISLEATKNLTYQLLITDLLGRKISSINEIKSNQNVDIQLEQSGLYFIHLVKNGQTVISKKLLVQ